MVGKRSRFFAERRSGEKSSNQSKIIRRIRKTFAIACSVMMLSLSACSPAAANNPSSGGPDAQGTNSAAGLTNADSLLPLEYYSPVPDAQYVSKDTSIIMRYGPHLNNDDLSGLQITVQGSLSGNHAGNLILADDRQTVIFKPDQVFTAGEQVQIQVNSLSFSGGEQYQSLDYSFTIAVNQKAGGVASIAVPTSTPASGYPNYLTLPKDIPHYSVTMTSPFTAGEGYFFVAPFYWGGSTVGSYLLILDNNGQIVYYKYVGDQFSGFDFKPLPGGYLTYFDQKNSVHVIMNAHYQVIGTYPAENGYTSDLHDFLMMLNGNVLLMAYDTETVDMSKIVSGGNPEAAVTGLIIQELDADKNVIFEWRSWDHFAFTDSEVSLTSQTIDLIHGNGLAIDSDGNLLLSSRNLNEVTKISLHSGAIMWRLGGKNSTFRFTNDEGFQYQHNVAVLPDGDITLFDNHGTDTAPTTSRAVEYRLDLNNKTATLVWDYVHIPAVFTDYMGDTERLADGNTVIGWGDPYSAKGYAPVAITEVSPTDQVLFELAFDKPYVSYRAFREPWIGVPDTTPALAFSQNGTSISLGYSWNGATEVASWKLYDGTTAQDLKLVEQRVKSGFETQSYLPYLPSNVCYFQVAALDKNGNELSRSSVLSTNTSECPPVQ
jgi:hypothetical protein